MTLSSNQRDFYIDFLRAFGLLMLVVAHTWAPLPLATLRSFDVPLMVFISAICFKPIKMDIKSIGKYIKKRFLRIYLPVFIFVNFLFLCVWGIEFYTKQHIFSIYQYLGSLLLLNYPSIGYVWIMRVFLMIAIVLPFVDILIRRTNWMILCLALLFIIGSQELFIRSVPDIPNIYVRYILSQTLLYIWGYLVFVILGIISFRSSYLQKWNIFLIGLIGTGIYIYITGNYFPQLDKYPPHGLYLLYGWVGCMGMSVVRPLLIKFANWKGWEYLSTHSMWIYLWHIIPVYYITPEDIRPTEWVIRYVFVLGSALFLNFLYQWIIGKFPDKYSKYLR